MAGGASHVPTMDVQRIRSHALAVVVLWGLVFLCFWRVFAGGVHLPIDVLYEETYPWKFQKPGVTAHILNNRDPIHLEFPIQAYVTDSIRDWRLPLWNPYLAGGSPELGTGIFGVFYPPNVVYYLLPRIWAINIDVMLHVFMAGFFMYLYVYHLGRSVLGGIVAGASFMFSGILTLYYSLYPEYHVIPWLPLAFLCMEKLIVGQRARHAVLLGGVIAVQFLAGQMQYIFYNQLALMAYFLLRSLVIMQEARAFGSVKRPLGLALLAGGIGAALGAVQLIPTLELIPLSQRSFRSYDEMISLGRSSWLSVLTALSPNAFGSLADRNWFGPGYPSTTMAYIGIPSLLLMFIYLVCRRDKHVFVLAGVGLLAWLVALGTPFVHLLYTVIPGFSGLRQVGRAIYIYAVVGAALAGLGFAVLEQGMTESAHRRLARLLIGIAAVWGVIAVSVAAILLWKDRLLHLAIESFSRYAGGKGWTLAKPPEHYAERIDWMVQYELRHAVIFLMVAAAAVLLIVGWQRGWFQTRTFKLALAILVIADLLRFPLTYVHIVDLDQYPLYELSDSIAFLKRDREKFRILSLISCGTGQAFHPNTLMPYGLEAIQAYNSFLPGRFGKFLQQVEGGDATCGGGSKHQNLFMPKHFPNNGIGRLLNVKYVVTPPVGPLLEEAHLKLVFDSEVRIYENLGFLPRTFFVPQVQWAQGDADILAKLVRADFEPRATVVLEGEPEPKGEVHLASGSTHAEVRIEDYQASEVKIDVTAGQKGWLVLLDNYFPGWQAFIDGKPTKIYRANFTFRAVSVPAGQHRIEFLYRPLSFTLGALLTCVALIGCVVIWWRDRRLTVMSC